MDFLSDLQKKSNSSSETQHPEKNDQNQNQHQHRQPSNSELMASAKVLAEAGQTTFSQGVGKVDKARVAEAGGDVLAAASSYGKLEEKSYGKYVEKAETYLEQYGNPSSQSHSTKTTTPNYSSSPSTTTDSKPHSAAVGGGPESEGCTATESESGGYLKMAQGFLKK